MTYLQAPSPRPMQLCLLCSRNTVCLTWSQLFVLLSSKYAIKVRKSMGCKEFRDFGACSPIWAATTTICWDALSKSDGGHCYSGPTKCCTNHMRSDAHRECLSCQPDS
eukprot:Blabericola_migrator_1__10236@NODE_5729_length_689_cov_11_345659_g3749_i0_p1_GENE_NODE_5729_length_689_cov_11_345659_g3749_i0NODE_5729_length_689_cov_11_345659_g3749_i0_p1_ORF_typecomplete_len108_score3_06DUF5637/PF18687_1/1_4e03DUF5637/PF18687_1/0_078_NODE_5729_length_689_cov_11_345659_g3749_i019342